MKKVFVAATVFLLFLTIYVTDSGAGEKTWAERLGWGSEDRVLIIHSDDVGMCHSTNLGAIKGLEEGVVSSISIMMACPWVGEIAKYLSEHPEVDFGLHLALTSEWDYYRFRSVAGKPLVPGLADEWGCLWDNVPLVVKHASPLEVEIEIRAQIDRASDFGLKPTHIDSHMGTLFATEEYFERFVKVGIETGLPILAVDLSEEELSDESSMSADKLHQTIVKIWNAGFPVLDGLIGDNYGWKAEEKKALYIDTLRNLEPGLTEMIVHCAARTEEFMNITRAAERWIADGDAMVDPEIRKVIEEEGIILTNWREIKNRRDKYGYPIED
jgi:hypothetical protein